MKIISQSADGLVLKEGASGVGIGAVFIVVGVLTGYYGHSSSPIGIQIALALVVAGLVAIFFSSSINVNANRTSGQLLYQKKRLIGARNTAYAISDILRIETRKRWLVESPPNGNQGIAAPPQKLVSQSVMVFKDGREMPLDRPKTSQRMLVSSQLLTGGQSAEVATATQVAKFLCVPFQEILPPGLGAGMQTNIG